MEEAARLHMIMNLNKNGIYTQKVTIPPSRNHKIQHITSQVPIKTVGLTDNPSSIGESSVITIGLPSVISQGGGPTMLKVQSSEDSQSSTINLNMNMAFNITNPITYNDQKVKIISNSKQKAKRTKKSGNSSAEKSSMKIQQLINAQRTNDNSLSGLKRISNHIAHLNFQTQQNFEVQKSHQKSFTKTSGLQPQPNRRMIPVK